MCSSSVQIYQGSFGHVILLCLWDKRQRLLNFILWAKFCSHLNSYAADTDFNGALPYISTLLLFEGYHSCQLGSYLHSTWTMTFIVMISIRNKASWNIEEEKSAEADPTALILCRRGRWRERKKDLGVYHVLSHIWAMTGWEVWIAGDVKVEFCLK